MMVLDKHLKNADLPKKIIMFVSVVTCLALGIFVYVTYDMITQMSKRTFDAVNVRSMGQAVNTLDIISKEALDSCKQFATSKDFSEYELFKNSKYYESIKEPQSEDEQFILYNYLKVKNKIKDNLGYINVGNNMFLSVYFYDLDKDLILLNDGRQYSTNTFFDTNWITYIGNKQTPYITTVQRNGYINVGISKEMLSYIYEISPKHVMMINLDVSKLTEQLTNSIFVYQDNIAVVMSDSNKELISIGNKEDCNDIVNNQNYYSGEFTKTHKLKNGKYYFFHTTTKVLGWNIYLGVPKERLSDLFAENKLAIMCIIILLSVLPLLVVNFLAKKLYKPLQKLADKYRGKDETSDSLSFIENMVEHTIKQNKGLIERLNESMPAYIEKFILSLLKKEDYTKEEIEDRLKFCNISFSKENYLVVILGLDYTKLSNLKAMDMSLIMLDIKDIIKHHSEKTKCVYVSDDDWSIAVILNCDENYYNEAYEFTQELKDEVKNNCNLDLAVGMGNCYNNLTKVHLSYKEAYEAYKVSVDTKEYDVISVDAVNVEEDHSAKHPSESFQKILRCIKYSEKSEAIDAMVNYTKRVKESDVPVNLAKRWYTGLVSEIISVGTRAGIKNQNLFHYENNYLTELSKYYNIDNMHQYVIMIVEDIVDFITETASLKNSIHINRIKELIDSKNGNITLAEVADNLSLNPSYISRLFKKDMRMTFTEYLVMVRMEHAMKLLKETDLKVYEIGERVGYNSSFYFIKTFKMYADCTPVDYRKNSKNKI